MNWTGKIAHYFIHNGKLSLLLLIFLFVWGVLSFFQTTKKYNPTIVAPAFQVIVDYPGATKTEVVEQITKPLENVISDISGVEDIYSVSVSGGRSIINVSFYVGENLNDAKISLNDRIRSDMRLAPLNIKAPLIVSLDPEEVPVVTLALRSQEHGPVELRKHAFKIRDSLAVVEGTSRIFVVGGRKRELSIVVDQKQLSKYAIGLHHIQETLEKNNLFLPAGKIKGKSQYIQLETWAFVSNPEEVGEIVIVTNDGVNIRLKDVASIKESTEEIEEYVRHKNKNEVGGFEAVLISVAKLKGHNISTVTENINQKIAKISKSQLPKGMSIATLVDDGKTAKDEINGLLTNLLSSIIIVIIVLLIFLNFKAAILVSISIPLTLASVFGVSYLNDQSINRITLFALILSLGLLVDNATVVIENIMRKVSQAKEITTDLFAQAVDEVGPGLFMSTVTTVFAFIPMAFISGMMGPYMGPIPFFVPAALILALIISYTINPWMASLIIMSSKSSQKNQEQAKKSALMEMYKTQLRKILESSAKRKMVLFGTLFLVLASASLPALYLVKFRMLPKADVDQFTIYVDLPAGSPLETTYDVSKFIEKEMLNVKDVKMVQSYVGTPPVIDFNGLFKGVSSRSQYHQASIRVGLYDDSKREQTSEDLVIELRRSLNSLLKTTYPSLNIKTKLIEDPPGPPVISTFLLRVQSEDEGLIKSEMDHLYPMVQKIPGVVDIDISTPEKTKTLQVEIDHFETSKAKITPAQIVQTLNTLYSGKVLGIYHHKENIEQEVIRLRFNREDREDPETLKKIFIRNNRRISIPLERLAKIKYVDTTVPLFRENHTNTSYIYGEMDERSITYAAIDVLKYLYKYKLSDGQGELKNFNLFGATYKSVDNREVMVSIGGEWELTLEVFRDLILAMMVAIMAIYFVLVAQFKSFLGPLIIMSTIPLSIVGVFPGFMILNFVNGSYFTATSMIGIIALAGIAVNNSIILLEYLNSLRKAQMSIIDALVTACATRLRPIALTTVTTMLGSMTILNDPVWAGLAWAIILGLGMSSALILVVFPSLYMTYMQDT
jgi:multidrug efflux pump subunit AcrB